MNDKFAPASLLKAFSIIEDDLPLLIGESDWNSMAKEYSRLLHQLRDSQDEETQLELCVELVDLLTPFKPAKSKLASIVNSLDLRSRVLTDVALLAEKMNCPAEGISQFNQEISRIPSSTKAVFMKEDFSKAKSVKLGNYNFNFGNGAEIAAGIFSLINTTFSENNYLLAAAGILLIAAGLSKALTVEISEQDASVFWGLIKAGETSKTAKVDLILKHTNQEREKVWLDSLSEKEAKNSLLKLSVIGCVQKVNKPKDGWQIIENLGKNNSFLL